MRIRDSEFVNYDFDHFFSGVTRGKQLIFIIEGHEGGRIITINWARTHVRKCESNAELMTCDRKRNFETPQGKYDNVNIYIPDLICIYILSIVCA